MKRFGLNSGQLHSVFALVVCLLSCVSLQAFDATGHDTSANIAEANLEPLCRKAVMNLLGKKPLWTVANYPDEIRHQDPFKHTAGYHFDDLDEGITWLDNLRQNLRQIRTTGNATLLSLYVLNVLRDSKASDAKKTNALAWFIHVAADKHQPLHAGHPLDKGGNSIIVSYNGIQTNLHALWDGRLSEKANEALFAGLTTSDTRAAALSKLLLSAEPPELLDWSNAYLKDFPQDPKIASALFLPSWIDESLAARPFAYDTNALQQDPAEYTTRANGILNHRLWLSGIRTAFLLNSIFGKNPSISTAEIAFRKQVDSILQTGIPNQALRVDDIISLEPQASQTP